ncbi:MAG: anaerobic sulfatase maturase [Actinobacteria bacterium]|nr:anaerobic sulfatase maturase [Actinomycetota bacterium]
MPPVNILIKPASSACNLRCKYCFYKAIAENRKIPNAGMLSEDMLDLMVKKVLEFADDHCGFAFQGGEPTLVGLKFFKKLIELQKKYNTKRVVINNTLQTNGYTIDEEWCRFLTENNFLVGLSLDGPQEIHNLNRKTVSGGDTYNRLMKTAALFYKFKVQLNILSVVTGLTARKIEKIYNFYKKNGFRYLQFIPCLEPLEVERGGTDFYLSPEVYSKFLCQLFDLWFDDFKKDKYISIRQFDNYINIMADMPPEACNMNGKCSIQFVIEGDGSVYPCDYYVYDKWRIGTIGENSLAEMISGDVAKSFVAESVKLPEKCRICRYVDLCRNGCKRDRILTADGEMQTAYCKSYKEFFEYTLPRLQEASLIVERMRM